MTHDLIVIGAGPAGMSAAVTAADLGLRTLLIDEQARPGGQIYRNVTNVSDQMNAILGRDYSYGRQLVAAFEAAEVDVRLSSLVWDITPDLSVLALQNGNSLQFRAPQLIVATGALERPLPLPGWTLPGVLNAGAAQIAMKSGGSIPCGKIVLVGGGPLLLLVACQLLDAGATIAGIVETSPKLNLRRALPWLPGAIQSPKLLYKGYAMMRRLRKADIIWFKDTKEIRVEGQHKAEALTFCVHGHRHRLAADTVLLHHGVIPNTQISRLLRADHDWNNAQLAWQPRLNAFRETSVSGLRIAGDGGGIAGAIAAEASGRLAAIGAAYSLGQLSECQKDRLAAKAHKDLEAQTRIRSFLDELYRPPLWLTAPKGDTIVCRCEEVTAAEIRTSAILGSRGPNQTKFYNRCGMGPCQGRMCGSAVTQILADELSASPAEVGAYRVRSPLKPITLEQLATLSKMSTKQENA